MASQVINEVLDPDAEIIFGAVLDDTVGDEVQITVIATGFADAIPEQQPVAPRYDYEAQPPAARPSAPAAAQPAPTQPQPPQQPPRQPAQPAAGPVNIQDTELPTFLRRTISSR